ncbi:L,D-transpeptidase [Sporolactobacillus kofuensis]|uniref:L,D-transpeptidase n=1 Tax=Sporolactobacillus kofuensis TaxID=269672 RepID=A0ABW1WFU4_9BACL|nr:L,D-transpeptidase [Sporolactobacillus kofuensis]MCO7175066.1 L,D-transpeptidase [Sporolactobacillus kofuensis]
MNLWTKGYLIALVFLLTLTTTACSQSAQKTTDHSEQQVKNHKTVELPTRSKANEEKKVAPVNWNKPSGGAYPIIKKNEPIWIDVSIKAQKVYIKDGRRILYTMIASTGKDTNPDTTTPTGTYYIQAERGKWFYAPKYKEGAKYWVSWKNHGEFLFHSVPMDQNQQILTADAKKLGQKDSHGCIHLTVPDAKWVYEHIPYQTKVVIHS